MFSINPQFEQREGYLSVTCAKYASTFHKQRTLDQVVESIKKNSVNKILFDVREALTSMSDDDHEICGYLLAERADFFHDCKIAFLTPNRKAVPFLSLAYADGFTSFVELESHHEASLWFSGQIK